jgi:type III secretion protein J
MKYICSFLLCCLLILTGCETKNVIINDVDEREANEIIVFLASKNISAEKVPSPSTSPGGGDSSVTLWSIAVQEGKTTDAMAILNQNGLPRKKGTNLLSLFAKQGLMSTDKEETIRYQAGLAEQIANMIRKIDGVIDADVQLSFPPQENTGAPGQAPPQRMTAAVYVKHQGIIDDPNSHLVTKIKRLVAGSVNGLDVNDVTVISDRSRFTDITLHPIPDAMMPKSREYVSIWSIVLSKDSASRFRFLFFILTTASVLLTAIVGWLIWKFYPILKRKGGFKSLLHPRPLDIHDLPSDERK